MVVLCFGSRLRIVQILCGKCCKMQPDNNPYNRGVVPKQSLNKMASLNVTTHTSRARGSSLSSVSGPSKKVSLEYTVSVANSRPRANSRWDSLFFFIQWLRKKCIVRHDIESLIPGWKKMLSLKRSCENLAQSYKMIFTKIELT